MATNALLFLALTAFLAAPSFAQQRPAEVSSLKPADIAEFDAQPKKVRDILTYALQLTEKNLAYRYGSNNPTSGGMDCSGTVSHILNHLGYKSPRQSNTIYLWLREKGNLREVKGARSLTNAQLKELSPGDVLFWEGTYDVGERFPPTSHVMIYLGKRKKDGKPVMVGASSGRTYDGKSRHGVSVFDFRLPRIGSKSKFVGFGPVPGVKNLDLKLSPLKKPGKRQKSAKPEKSTKVSNPRGSTLSPENLEDAQKPAKIGIPLKNPRKSPPSSWGPGQHGAVAKTTDSIAKEPWRYLVYLPKTYDSAEKSHPLILYLHGRSIRGRDLRQLLRYGPPALLPNKPNFPFVVASPQLPDGSWPAASLHQFLDEILGTYRVDPQRVYLTGASMGAGGAWNLAAARPERFAALAPICAYGNIALAPKFADLPIWAFHGDADEIVPIEPHKQLIAAVNKAGGSAKLSVFPGGTHGDVIMPVYKMQELYDWFLTHKRESPPEFEKVEIASEAAKPALVARVIKIARDASDPADGTDRTDGKTGSAIKPDAAQAFLAYHNEKRAEVGVPALSWSPQIAAEAQKWADRLAKTGKFEHRPRTGEWATKFGENLGAGYGNGYNALSAAARWYGEKEHYQPGSAIPESFANFKAGHYTQMVWRETKELGAGVAVIQTGRMKGWTVVVCNYSPAGNYIGRKPF